MVDDRTLAWTPLDGSVWHLVQARTWGKDVPSPHPVCGCERGHLPPVVYKPDGNAYCRRCVFQEGVNL